jgi:hypothetical protein
MQKGIVNVNRYPCRHHKERATSVFAIPDKKTGIAFSNLLPAGKKTRCQPNPKSPYPQSRAKSRGCI